MRHLLLLLRARGGVDPPVGAMEGPALIFTGTTNGRAGGSAGHRFPGNYLATDGTLIEHGFLGELGMEMRGASETNAEAGSNSGITAYGCPAWFVLHIRGRLNRSR